jgi:transposase-like protein
MSLRDIKLSHQGKMYDTEGSHTVLSQITDRTIPEVKAWQSRPLEEVYCIVWLDAMHYKGWVYDILGINCDGYKQVLGTYVSESEGANFWLQVLSDMQNRGLQDILIACTGNLKGFSEGIRSSICQGGRAKLHGRPTRNSLK